MRVLHVLLVLSFYLLTVAVAQRDFACSATNKKVVTLKKNVRVPLRFCKWWVARKRYRSVFNDLTLIEMDNVCKCIVSKPALGKTTTMPSPKPLPPAGKSSRNLVILKNSIASPIKFCQFWIKENDRETSPFSNLNTQKMYPLCSSLLSLKTSTKKTTSKSVPRSPPTTPPNPTTTRATTSSTIIRTTTTISKSTVKPAPLPPVESKEIDVIVTSIRRTTVEPVPLTTTTDEPITTTKPACGDPTADLRPVTNSDISPTDLRQLEPAEKIKLYYAQPTPGRMVAILDFDMFLPTVNLGATSLLRAIECSSDSLTIRFLNAQKDVAEKVKSWPKRMTLITQSSGCNKDTERGMWIVEGSTSISDPLITTVVFKAKSATWAEVADTMDVSYGQRERQSSPLQNVEFSSVCASKWDHTLELSSTTPDATTPSTQPQTTTTTPLATTTPSTTIQTTVSTTTPLPTTTTQPTTTPGTTTTTTKPYVTPTALAQLSPGARDIVNFVMGRLRYNADGSIKVTPSNFSSPEITPAAWKPDDQPLQDALEDALQAAGLDPPGTFKNNADAAFDGICRFGAQEPLTSSPGRSKRDVFATYRERDFSYPHLHKRFGWDDAFDIGCSDLVSAFTGSVGEAVCAGKDIYDNRDAWACMFTGCFLSQQNPPPPTYQYDFTYAWLAKFYFPANTKVVTWGTAHSLTCIDCSLDISEIKITGQIKVILATGNILGASMAVSEKSKANMILGLKTSSALSYNWNTKISTIPLDKITVSGVFTITPTIIFSLGAEFSTNKPIDITAGARMTWGLANADIDMSSITSSNVYGWQPSLEMTSPVFNTAAIVKIYPYMRRLYEISFSVLGSKISSKATFTSQTGIGFNTEYLETAGAGSCSINQLRLQSYASNRQNLVFQNGASRLLNYLAGAQKEQCFTVPSDKPTLAEIASLKDVGQQFCTEYNNYNAPRVPYYTTGTVSTVTTTTSTTTSTVNTTPTTTTTTTSTSTAVQFISMISTTTNAGSAGAQTLAAQYQKRDSVPLYTSSPGVEYVLSPQVTAESDFSRPSATLQKRLAPTPDMVTAWDAAKIRYACSQVATGISTITFTTSYVTVFTSTTTLPATSYTNVAAAAVTSTVTLTDYGWSTSTTYTATATLDSTCPLQSQASCFTITGHGVSTIEGKQLSVSDGLSYATFDGPASVFYLACDKSLVTLPGVRALVSSDGVFDFQRYAGTTRAQRIKCSKDLNKKELTCTGSDGNDLLYVWKPSTKYWLKKYTGFITQADPLAMVPSFNTANTLADYGAISLTYANVPCSCGAERSTDLVLYSASTPRCPVSGGTTFTSATGQIFQVQCSISYAGSVISTSSQTSIAACANACAANVECVAATFAADNTCSLLFATTSAPLNAPDSALVHTVVRISGIMNVLTNPTFAGTGAVVGGVSNTLVMSTGTVTSGNGRYVTDMNGDRVFELFVDRTISTATDANLRMTITGLVAGKYYRWSAYIDKYCSAGSISWHYHTIGQNEETIAQGAALTGVYTNKGPIVYSSSGTTLTFDFHMYGGTNVVDKKCGAYIKRASMLGPYNTAAEATF